MFSCFQLDFENINLANDILDGSFRSASSNQSAAGNQSHDKVPGISGLDLAAGISDDRLHNRGDNSDIVNSVVNAVSSANATNSVPSLEVSSRNDQVGHGNEAERDVAASANQGAALAQVSQPEQNGAGVEGDQNSAADAILQRALEEKENLQKV